MLPGSYVFPLQNAGFVWPDKTHLRIGVVGDNLIFIHGVACHGRMLLSREAEMFAVA